MRARRGRAAATVALGLLLIGTPLASAGSAGAQPAAAAPGGEGGPAAALQADAELGALLDSELDAAQAALPNDPFERANRGLLKLNQGLERVLFDPLMKAYRFAVPDLARRSLRRAFVNLNAPVVLVNDLLQLRLRDAAETLGCFVLNTAFGVGGLFDAASEAGWQVRHADFGQTLAKAGVTSGPYLIVPILGPSTVRDGFGEIVDQAMHPLTYLVGPSQRIFFGSGSGFTELESHSEQLRALRESSIDFYAALRSVYLQNRRAQIWGQSEPIAAARVAGGL